MVLHAAERRDGFQCRNDAGTPSGRACGQCRRVVSRRGSGCIVALRGRLQHTDTVQVPSRAGVGCPRVGREVDAAWISPRSKASKMATTLLRSLAAPTRWTFRCDGSDDVAMLRDLRGPFGCPSAGLVRVDATPIHRSIRLGSAQKEWSRFSLPPGLLEPTPFAERCANGASRVLELEADPQPKTSRAGPSDLHHSLQRG